MMMMVKNAILLLPLIFGRGAAVLQSDIPGEEGDGNVARRLC